jgi:RNA polymerase sigma-70 factor (ECF subfamily)
MPSVTRKSEHSPSDARFNPEPDLLAGLLANEASAWRAFQTKYERLIVSCIMQVARRFPARIGSEDVREICANFYLSLIEDGMHKCRKFDPQRGQRFGSWVGLLAVHAAYDYLRVCRREPICQPLSVAMSVPSTDAGPFDIVDVKERTQMVRRALANFSTRDRTFATLYFADGKQPSDIAEELNISIKTVYSKRHKIQSRLDSAIGGSAAA